MNNYRERRRCSCCKCYRSATYFLPIKCNGREVAPKTCKICRSRRSQYYKKYEAGKHNSHSHRKKGPSKSQERNEVVSAIPSPTCPLLIDEAIYDTDYHLIDNLNHDININWNDREEYSDFFSTDSILFCDSVEYPFTEEHVYYNDSTDRLFGEWFKQDTSLEL